MADANAINFDSDGAYLPQYGRAPRLFRIESGTNPYAATEVWVNEETGVVAALDGWAATVANKTLYEAAGVTTVPAGAIVEATPNTYGTGFYFKYVPSASGSGSGDTGRFTEWGRVCFSFNELGYVVGGYQEYTVIDATTGEVVEFGCAPIEGCGAGSGCGSGSGPSPFGAWYCYPGGILTYFAGGEVATPGYTGGPYVSAEQGIEAGCLPEPDPPTGERWYCIELSDGTLYCSQNVPKYGMAEVRGIYGSQSECEGACAAAVLNCTTCPDTSLPAVIVATVTGAIAPCTCANGASAVLTRSGSPGSYAWVGNLPACGGFGGTALSLSCIAGIWSLFCSTTVILCGPTTTVAATGGTCSPLEMTFITPVCYACAAGGTGDVTITITA